MLTMKLIVNALAYQAIWFSAILWATPGAIAGCLIIALLFSISGRKGDDLRMTAFLIFLGMLLDGSLQQVGFFTFTNTGWPIPFWLLIIWIGLAMTIHHSLAWLKERLLLAAIFGGIGGPAAYWAGTRMGAASFNLPLSSSLLVLAALWALIFPTIMLFSRKTDRCDSKQLSKRKNLVN